MKVRPMPHYKRLLITGAAGALGSVLREGLSPLARTIRLTDRTDMGEAQPHEEIMPAELGDFAAVMEVVDGCDAIVHFGAAPMERPWEEILNSSIRGGYNVYEAARRHGIKRIVYASSIHAVGYVRREAGADTNTEHRPDTLYGLSKCFVETSPSSTSTSSASSPRCCASTPAMRSRRIAGTWLPG
jgi:uronate dehydrogenase